MRNNINIHYIIHTFLLVFVVPSPAFHAFLAVNSALLFFPFILLLFFDAWCRKMMELRSFSENVKK